MARNKIILDTQKLQHLSAMAQKRFGSTLSTSRDCITFAQDLKAITNIVVSAQTIKRFFGVVKNNNSPSHFTLNAIAKYAAQTNWVNYKHVEEKNDETRFADFILDFYSLDTFANLTIINKLAESQALRNLVLTKIAHLPKAHWCFFEARPLRDFLSGNYTEALKIYVQTKKNNEAQIYGYGLLFLSAFLTKNKAEIKLYFNTIQKIILSDDVFHIPAARKFGVPLMYHHLKNNETEFAQTFNQALIARKQYVQNTDYYNTNFDSNLIEHLLIIERYKECKILLDLHIADKIRITGANKTDDHYYRQIFNLITAYSLYQINKKNECLALLKKFDIGKLHSGEKSFYNILYIQLLLKLTPISAIKKRKILIYGLQNLVNQTNYIWFNAQINRLT